MQTNLLQASNLLVQFFVFKRKRLNCVGSCLSLAMSYHLFPKCAFIFWSVSKIFHEPVSLDA